MILEEAEVVTVPGIQLSQQHTNFIADESVRSPGPPCSPTLPFGVCLVLK